MPRTPAPGHGRAQNAAAAVHDNLDIGRPDKVSIVFGRTIRQRGEFRIPGTFRTQVITNDTCPYLYRFYKKTQVKQCLKEGGALRTDTTGNQPRDLGIGIGIGIGIGKELTNLAAMAKAGYAANRRLLDAECISPTRPPEPPPWRCSPDLSSPPPAPASRACASPTPASRRSSRPAARSRSGPPASPDATCGTSSPPISGSSSATYGMASSSA